MLVLSRKKNESIIVGDDIIITVVEIRGDKVRLGIAAPKTVTVHRQEVYNAIALGGRIMQEVCPPCPRNPCQSADTTKIGVRYMCNGCGHSWPIAP
jgi:carbon storage regulator